MDDDDDIVDPVTQPVEEVVPEKIEVPATKDDKNPKNIRQWNMEKRRFNKPFARGYAFHDERKKQVFVPLKTYAFQDDETKTPLPSLSPVPSANAEVKKTTTPVEPEIEVVSQVDFPKLSEYERPRSPPYPPDDREYPTLAERLKRAIEKEASFVPVDRVPTMEMVSVIPVRTKFSSNLSIPSSS